jgi:hypothetical protein
VRANETRRDAKLHGHHREGRRPIRRHLPASQGPTRDVALSHLKEAVDLFLETADPEEIASRLRSEVVVTGFEVDCG